MKIRILGTESLGVRGLFCVVETRDRKICIDPGVALGWSRYGYLPHPFQVHAGVGVRDRIAAEMDTATDVVISHFDGDHCPLANPNAFQLGLFTVRKSIKRCRIWARGKANASFNQYKRRGALENALGREIPGAEGRSEGLMTFSTPVPHGRLKRGASMVMMSRFEAESLVFVHCSDIQFLESGTVDMILEWKPDIVLASGPPLYRLSRSPDTEPLQRARRNVLRLSAQVDTLVVDHHLLRSVQGVEWLERVNRDSENRICSAAEFMNRRPLYLEAWRSDLYEWMPVVPQWHKEYASGLAELEDYPERGWKILVAEGRVQPCEWYPVCPIKRFTDNGRLDRFWIENYCMVGNRSCRRFKLAAAGEPHSDTLLPDGSRYSPDENE